MHRILDRHIIPPSGTLKCDLLLPDETWIIATGLAFQFGYFQALRAPDALTSGFGVNVPLLGICRRKDSVKLLVGSVEPLDSGGGIERLSEFRLVPTCHRPHRRSHRARADDEWAPSALNTSH